MDHSVNWRKKKRTIEVGCTHIWWIVAWGFFTCFDIGCIPGGSASGTFDFFFFGFLILTRWDLSRETEANSCFLTWAFQKDVDSAGKRLEIAMLACLKNTTCLNQVPSDVGDPCALVGLPVLVVQRAVIPHSIWIFRKSTTNIFVAVWERRDKNCYVFFRVATCQWQPFFSNFHVLRNFGKF